MDDTQQSRISDAAATRKRRSSILKSQRPPRTPFSELEFNVATPTETAKSRRVSFSRRTGVAEFVTNEATTTWKNFYEEHNKSLESSGNESGANAPRAPIGHIGKRIFDQQFEEVEAVDFGLTLDNHANRNVNSSMNNVNFEQQLASLECINDGKLTLPQQNFEMSEFTDNQSKLFGDDIALPTMGEMSGRIDVNFSAMQAIGDVKDDLDEIQQDLQRAQSNVVCPGPFTGRKSLSEYIEVDLNATHISVKNGNEQDDDMSITDTIHSPKVQDISKNCSTSQPDRKSNVGNDWVADKENIVLNPYVAPKETANFAINDESDKILVFDGKRLTVQSDKEADLIINSTKDESKLIAPIETKPHQRKTIVLNVNDDLPNFVDNPMSTSNGFIGSSSFKQSVIYDDDDISITQPLVSNVNSLPERNKTILNDNVNISFTQAVSNVILPAKPEKRRTIVFENDNCDISMTQALPSKIIGNENELLAPGRRRTILYENETGNISITQAIPANIIMNEKPEEHEKSKTVVFDNIEADISMTQAVPAHLILSAAKESLLPNIDVSIPLESEKRKTIVFESDNGDISMTQVLPSKIIVPQKTETERRLTVVYDDDLGNISVTQAIPSNIIRGSDFNENDRSKTVIYIQTAGEISMTRAIPTNLLIPGNVDKSIVDVEKRRTVVFDNDDCDISMTQVLPTKIIDVEPEKVAEKRKTIIYSNDTGNISVTQAIPTEILMSEQLMNINKTVCNNADVSMHEEIAEKSDVINIKNNIHIVDEPANTEKRKTIVFENESCDISMTQVIPSNIVMENLEKKDTEKRKSDLYGNLANESATQAVTLNKKQDKKIKTENLEKSNKEKRKSDFYDKLVNKSPTQAVAVNLLLVEHDKNKTIHDLCEENENVLKTQPDTNDFIRIVDDIDKTTDMKNETQETRHGNEASDVSRTKVLSSIHIVSDIEVESQTDRLEDNINKSLQRNSELPKIRSLLSIGYTEEVDVEVTADLPKQPSDVRNLTIENNSPKHYQKRLSPDMNVSKSGDKLEMSKTAKSFKDANDTNELLEMLSDLTDKSHYKEKAKLEPEMPEPRRLSVAPNRQSIVISREDLMNNISMAQAALQMSMDDDIDESLVDLTTDTPVEVHPPSKAARVSAEVVKKLKFEDESASDASMKSELRSSPLKKTAFGETSYMKETTKAKVIPGYLKDVSDGIKALMQDLVKPNADLLQVDVNEDKCLNREPSTCSTQIQANLLTSSQIDVHAELFSDSDSAYDLDKQSTPKLEERSLSPRCSLKSEMNRSAENEVPYMPKVSDVSSKDKVIVFDHYNPLNNVLLSPIDLRDAHKYEPPKSSEMLCEKPSRDMSKVQESVENSNIQIVGNVTLSHTMQPSGDTVPDKLDAQSLLSNASKPPSIDESISARVWEVKDTKVNTVIAMKGNKELLEASSSLTLVDDALAKNAFDVDIETVTTESSTRTDVKPDSPAKAYNDEEASLSEKIDLTSDTSEPVACKGKKRIYSPTKKDKHRHSNVSIEVTPKPVTKMQKLSYSPKSPVKTPQKQSPIKTQVKLTPEKDVNKSKSLMEVESSDKKKSPRKSKNAKAKPGTNVTVQQLITQYDIHPDIDQEELNKQIIEALSRTESSTAKNTISISDIQSVDMKCLDVVSSFTSSKNQNEALEVNSTVTEGSGSLGSKRWSKSDWQPEALETAAVKLECESSVNVVARIDMLPFMGSPECEWDAHGVDSWAFSLLHSRLRLAIRLEHRHDNATRTRVRADTRVLAVTLDAPYKVKQNTVAALCIDFAADSMRYCIGRGCCTAGEVPLLLKKCAAIARLAMKWGRAMHEARLHLAYTISGDASLALKVANIPLRSVWEVTIRLELVTGTGVPWPKASDVRVTRVVAEAEVGPGEVETVLARLPEDWGHTPATLWKIFRYLKNKTRDDILAM